MGKRNKKTEPTDQKTYLRSEEEERRTSREEEEEEEERRTSREEEEDRRTSREEEEERRKSREEELKQTIETVRLRGVRSFVGVCCFANVLGSICKYWDASTSVHIST
jgi:hypothetical protein